MPLPATIEQPTREAYRVSLDPVRSAIISMMFVTKGEEMPGTGAWISQTRAKLSAEELFRHRLVIIGFYFTFQTERDWASFPEYLQALEKIDPVVMRDKMLNIYVDICMESGKVQAYEDVDWDQVLSSVDHYLDFLKCGFEDEYIEIDVETKAYEYIIDPPAMKSLIIDHLRWFWDEHLAQEWARTEPLVRESVKAFQHTEFDNMSRIEVVRYITGQDIEDGKWSKKLGDLDQIVFVPNPHVGPYVSHLCASGKLVMVFGARQPEDASIRIPELDRADIVARMSALADDTRLSILQMTAERGELRSQDIIEETGLSQPSVSRYLTQLTATGYLQERRVNGSKAYALNRDRIEKTLKAVHNFLLGSN